MKNKQETTVMDAKMVTNSPCSGIKLLSSVSTLIRILAMGLALANGTWKRSHGQRFECTFGLTLLLWPPWEEARAGLLRDESHVTQSPSSSWPTACQRPGVSSRASKNTQSWAYSPADYRCTSEPSRDYLSQPEPKAPPNQLIEARAKHDCF